MTMEQSFRDYFRPPDGLFRLERIEGQATSPGWFRFGTAVVYGTLTAGEPASVPDGTVPDVTSSAVIEDGIVRLPFDPDEVARNLRCEAYLGVVDATSGPRWRRFARRPYYLIRPLLPVPVRKHLQRRYLRDWRSIPYPSWPVDTSLDRFFMGILDLVVQAVGEPLPVVWFWPEGRRACVVLTHDVETHVGLDRCLGLATLDASVGARASFQFVPERRYGVPDALIEELRARGCDVNIHGLNHDGNLFRDRATFAERVPRIREHAERVGAAGFRSPVLYRNAEWLAELGFAYDMSIPNVGHLDPQRGGCCTVLPFFLGETVELPLTTVQDYSLLHVLEDRDLSLWRQQLALVTDHFGLACFNIHPDYLDDDAVVLYEGLLRHLARSCEADDLWWPSPGEAASWWRQRAALEPTRDGGAWRVDGDGAGAMVALAHRSDRGLAFSTAATDYVIPEGAIGAAAPA
jgi:hypothetical protein